MKKLFGIAAAVVVLGMLSPARGDIVIEQPKGGSGDPIDTLAYVKVTDTTAYGYFLGDKDKTPVVNFTTDVKLTVPSGGQAKIEADSTLFTSITIKPETEFVLLGFEANPTGGNTSGTFTVKAYDQKGLAATEVFTFDANGQNFFTATASKGQVITLLTVEASGALIKTISQVRLDATTPTEVPEPASIAMLGFSSLVGLGYAWRRRRRAVA